MEKYLFKNEACLFIILQNKIYCAVFKHKKHKNFVSTLHYFLLQIDKLYKGNTTKTGFMKKK